MKTEKEQLIDFGNGAVELLKNHKRLPISVKNFLIKLSSHHNLETPFEVGA